MPVPITTVAQVTITVGAKTISRTGFGVPMFMGYFPTSITTDRILTYTGATALADMITDGFAATDPLYLMVSAALQQDPRIQTLKIGRLQAHNQIHEVAVSSIAVGDTVRLAVIDESGTEHNYAQTVTSTDVTSAIANLKASMSADITTLSCAQSASTLTCYAKTAGDVYYYFSNAVCTVKDTTTDPGFASDFAAIENEEEPSGWYAVLTDLNSKGIADATATYFATKNKIYFAQTNDSEVPTTASDCIGSELKNDNRDRTSVIYHHKGDLRQYPACAWAGKGLPKDPGSITWAYKVLNGVTNTVKTTTEITRLDSKNVNYVANLRNLNFTLHGKMSDGSSTTYIDVIRTKDFIQAGIEEDIAELMVNNDKIPYTNEAADLARGVILGVYEQAARNNAVELEEFTFEALDYTDQTAANKANRTFAGLVFGGTLTGATHKMIIQGTLS